MRFEELRLIAYGPFTDRVLRLGPGLNLLYGPNEAGKSSSLRAIKALLYGVPERTSDNFLHGNSHLRVGASLSGPRGTRLECVRRKGRKKTLLDSQDDELLEESVLRDLLGGVRQDFFESVFGIDHAALREGGEAVVRGEGHLGELLFAAGGVAHLREKQEGFAERLAELFKPGGSKPAINRAISHARTLKKEITDLQRSPEEWASHQEAHRKHQEEVQRLAGELEAAESSKSRLERIQAATGILAAWRAQRAELDALAGVPLLGEDAERRFLEASQQQLVAKIQAGNAAEELEKLTNELVEIQLPGEVLVNAEAIELLYRQLGAEEKASVDRATLDGQYRVARDAANEALRRLGWPLDLEQAEDNLLPDNRKARVRGLAAQHGEVQQSLLRSKKTVEKLEHTLAQLAEAGAAEAPGRLSASFDEAITKAQAATESVDRLEAAQAESEKLHREIDDRLARLPGWSGPLEELIRLPIPLIETVERHEESLRELVAEQRRLESTARSLHRDLERCREEITAHDSAGVAPDPEGLARSRRLRDRGVKLAVHGLRGETPPADEVAEFVAGVGQGADLAESLAPSVRAADEIADRLRREADRVAEKSQLVARHRSLEEQLERAADDQSGMSQAIEHAREEWELGWQGTGIAPRSPAEMRSWLRAYQEILSRGEILDRKQSEADRERTRIEQATISLESELRNAGAEFASGVPLGESVLIAQEFVRRRLEQHSQHERQADEIQRLREELNEARSACQAAEYRLEQWRADWSVAVEPLRLEPDAIPEQAEIVIECLESLERGLAAARGYKSRIWGIDKTAEEFAQRVGQLTASIAQDQRGHPPKEAVLTLHKRLMAARQAENARTRLAEQSEECTSRMRAAEQHADEACVALDGLRQQARCDTHEELSVVIERSAQKQRLAKQVEDLTAQLFPLCGGQTVEQFAAEVEAEDVDVLPVRIEELQHRLLEIRRGRDEAIAAAEREKHLLDQYHGDAAASEKAAEREFVLSKLSGDVHGYVVTATASRLLQIAIERYQEKAQGPVLSAASSHFQTLTCGAYQGFKTDFDDSGQEILVAVRDGGSRLLTEEMSEGTRDQVFLALRLGTIDNWLTTHDPLPFIVDDVLMTFDDERAAAALRSLVELSKRTQILFFTHHEHLVELARNSTQPGDPEVRFLPL